MERLGDDELLSIFKKITYDDDRTSFSLVSKRFLKVACARLMRLHNSLPALLFDILPSSTKLINFYCYESLSNAHMKLLATSCPKLFRLEIQLKADSEPSDVDIDFDDDGLCALANFCSRLFEINVSGRLRIGDKGIVSILRSCRNLGSLTLKGCICVTDESLKIIGELGRLSTIDLSECDRISDNGIIHLKQMVGLRYLNLSKCGVNVTDSGIVELLSQLPDIVSLDLSWLINVTDLSMLIIGCKCSRMRSLFLNGCVAITDEGLCSLAYLMELEELELSSCHNYSWDCVQAVVSTCPSLEELSLSWSIQISPTDYVHSLNNCNIYWDEWE